MTLSFLIPADVQKYIGSTFRGESKMAPLSMDTPQNLAAVHGCENLDKVPDSIRPSSSPVAPKDSIPTLSIAQTPIANSVPATPMARRSMDVQVVEDFDVDVASQEVRSRSSSIGSRYSQRSSQKQLGYMSTAKPKTCFQICHPPPLGSAKQMFRIRPKILLQLQQLSDRSRPTPALDVVPSSYFLPTLKRNFPRVFRGKDSLGSNDLAVVTSDHYDNSKDNSLLSKQHVWQKLQHKEVVGTICQLPKDMGGSCGKAEICLNYGDCWEACPLQNGSYEFVMLDDAGNKKTARWVPSKSHGSHRRSNQFQRGGVEALDEKKFNFSLVNPECRRHPIIASMTRMSIDVLDRYPSQSSSMGKHPPCAPNPATPESPAEAGPSFFDAPTSPDRVMLETDDKLRTLIVVTGIWVAFREHWSNNFSYNDAVSALVSSPHGNSSSSISQEQETPSGSGSRSSTPDRANLSRSSSVSGARHRFASAVLHRHSSTSATRPVSLTIPPSSTGTLARGNSNGKAFMMKVNRRSLISAAKHARHSINFAQSPGSPQEPFRGRTPPSKDRDQLPPIKPTLKRSSTYSETSSSTLPSQDLRSIYNEKKSTKELSFSPRMVEVAKPSGDVSERLENVSSQVAAKQPVTTTELDPWQLKISRRRTIHMDEPLESAVSSGVQNADAKPDLSVQQQPEPREEHSRKRPSPEKDVRFMDQLSQALDIPHSPDLNEKNSRRRAIFVPPAVEDYNLSQVNTRDSEADNQDQPSEPFVMPRAPSPPSLNGPPVRDRPTIVLTTPSTAAPIAHTRQSHRLKRYSEFVRSPNRTATVNAQRPSSFMLPSVANSVSKPSTLHKPLPPHLQSANNPLNRRSEILYYTNDGKTAHGNFKRYDTIGEPYPRPMERAPKLQPPEPTTVVREANKPSDGDESKRRNSMYGHSRQQERMNPLTMSPPPSRPQSSTQSPLQSQPQSPKPHVDFSIPSSSPPPVDMPPTYGSGYAYSALKSSLKQPSSGTRERQRPTSMFVNGSKVTATTATARRGSGNVTGVKWEDQADGVVEKKGIRKLFGRLF